MSERSYRRNCQLGVTGKYTPTCFTASGERISPDVTYLPDTHCSWADLEKLAAGPKKILNESMRSALNLVAQDHGLDSCSDIEFEHIRHVRELCLFLRRAAKIGGAIIADIDANISSAKDAVYDSGDFIHAVGIKILAIKPELLKLRSTWLPRGYHQTLEPEDLFDVMQHYTDPWSTRYPFNDANITFIPKP